MAMKLFKNPAAKHYFKAGLQKNRKFFVICLILHMISFPLAFTMLSIDIVADKSYDFLFDAFIIWSFVFTAIAVLLGVIIAIQNFSYLHKKQETDTYMSLPLSDKQRFFGDYFSGLLTYIAPVIISAVFTFITFAIAAAVINANPECGMSITPLEYGEHTIGWVEIIAEIYMLAIIGMIMLYTLITLACTLCGSLFETIVHTFLLNGAIPGMIALLCFIMFNRVPGVDFIYIMLPILAKTSPLGALIAYPNYADVMDEAVLLFPFFIKFWLWLVVFTVIYLALAYFVYKKRKSEDVGKPYVFKSYYYIVVSCATFAVCAMIPTYMEIMLIPMIVIAAVVFLAFELITNRGFKRFGKSIIKCVVTILASILLVGLLDNGWGFGVGRRVPDADSVKSVTIENFETLSGIEIDHSGVEFFEEDVIEAVIKAHEMASDRLCDEREFPGVFKNYYSYYEDMYDDGYYNYDYVEMTTITYKLKNGSSMTREYRFTEEERRIVSSVIMGKDYARAQAKEFLKCYKYNDYNVIKIFAIFLINNYTITTAKDNTEQAGVLSKEQYISFIEDMAKAIEEDILDRTQEQKEKPYSFCGRVGYVDVYEYDENILTTLKKYNVPILPLSEAISRLDKNPIEEIRRWTDHSTRYYGEEIRSERERELIEQLLMVAVPYDGNLYDSYYIELFQNYIELYIPNEYSDLAQELFDMGSLEFQRDLW